MTGVLLYGYLIGWMLTSSLAVFNAARAGRSRGLGIVAGALWPVFAVAVGQYLAIELIAALSRVTTGSTAPRTTNITSHDGHPFAKTV
ncbi:hypothetical protein ASD37_04570 [Mycobacterium sp. Root135]|uniref:hypothetical protein n=1 Tax=Mycobacterium sp. Root135 TaxID=1736457 RepID=UPI0006F4074C|nr:hypothetical protein [Mycobacterium sp. Root135]KQY09675.1 hypothetical protein ASD37_04570 [Mycobacterium sp. Root135]